MAAEVIAQDLSGWVVGVVLTGIVSVLGFFLRSSFVKVETGIESLGTKLDALKEGMARGDTRAAVLEARLVAVERTVERMEREVRELSEGVAR